TFWTFMVGTLALAGVWPLSGFYSKDAILAAAWHQLPALFVLGVVVAAPTTFYMFRLGFVAFYGAARAHDGDPAHRSPRLMVWPLRILAVMSIVGGVIGIEALFEGMFGAPAEESAGFVARLLAPFQHAPVAAFTGLGAFAVGLFAAWKLYGNAKSDPLPAK